MATRNGAKKCENGRPKRARKRQHRKCESEREQAKKRTTVENRQDSAKTLRVPFVAYSGGHVACSYDWVVKTGGAVLVTKQEDL